MNRFHLALLLWLLGGAAGQACARESEADPEILELRHQIEAMQEQLDALQARLSEIQNRPVAGDAVDPSDPSEAADSDTDYVAVSDGKNGTVDEGADPITGGACYNDFTFINPRVGNGAATRSRT